MRVIGVLDLLGGRIVRGVAGRRELYRPIQSQLCPSSEPCRIARALRDTFALRELYLADLDAIQGGPRSTALYPMLASLDVDLWIDAGVRSVEDGRSLAQFGIVVVGLETVASPEVVSVLAAELGQRLVFSLDLREGRPLSWGDDHQHIVATVVARGVRRLLVLDLARVGVGQGTGTEQLCAWIARTYPQVEIIAGGGVRGRADLERLRDCGVHAVLVASALHDGRLAPADLVLDSPPFVER